MDPIEKELQRRLQKKGGKCQAFTLATLKQATTNFGKKLGVGGFGEVFYGKLPDGQEVAVKTLSASSHQSRQEFFDEVSSYTTNFDRKERSFFYTSMTNGN
jgi:RIO-like serine/threonine protein kinase